MRRLSLAFIAALTLCGASAQAQILPVPAGQAAHVGLQGAVRDVVVGDPTVADVSVINERTLVVMGKRPGVTTLLAFDAAGRPLADRQVVVSEAGGGSVTVYRGAANTTNYACGAQCTRITPTVAAN
jgi:Flp pilus assembly secretin CpaC